MAAAMPTFIFDTFNDFSRQIRTALAVEDPLAAIALSKNQLQDNTPRATIGGGNTRCNEGQILSLTDR